MNRVIIFDLDGTLYQTHIPLLKAVNQSYHDLNLQAPAEKDITDLIGETSDVFIDKLAKNNPQINKIELGKKINFYEKKYCIDHGKLFEGVEETLKQLSDYYSIALCTNGSDTYAHNILSKYNIKQFFKSIKTRDINKDKTQLIKEIINETKAEFAIVVGDSDHDIIAAKNNKVISIGANYGYRSHTLNEADYSINNITELTSIAFKLQILSEIENVIANKKSNKPYVIGINGVDTSGKTIFSSSLKDYLIKNGFKVQLISIDEFHNHSSIRSSGENPIDSYINFAFNLDLLKNEVLSPISKGNNVIKELTLLDLDTDEYNYKKTLNINSETIVIIEGVLLYRDPINQYFNTRIFIDITFDEVLRRAKVRDVPKYGEAFLQKYITKYIPIQKKYIYKHNPKSKSNIIIDNNDYNKPRIV